MAIGNTSLTDSQFLQFSKNFNLPYTVEVSSNRGVSKSETKFVPKVKVYGFSSDIGRKSVSDNQIIKILANVGWGNGESYAIRGLLHKDLSTGVQTTFSAPVMPTMKNAISEAGASLNQVVQAASGGTIAGINAIMTRRVWESTSPMTISVQIKFVAIHTDKVREEVIEPCIKLQMLAAPTVNKIGIVNPPGPSIWGGMSHVPGTGIQLNQHAGTGDEVTISIGKFLIFKRVCISSVVVNWDNKFDSNGNPLSATCDLTFETYEMINKGDLAEMSKTENLDTDILSGTTQSLSDNQSVSEALSQE